MIVDATPSAVDAPVPVQNHDPAKPGPIAGQAVAAIVAIGAMAGIMPSLQPLLLAGFADEGRISVGQIGPVATAEALGMALSVGLAGVLMPPERLRPIAGLILGVAAALNLATGQVSGLAAILALRIGVGLCSGLMLWLLIGLLARVDLPARVTGYYVVAQGIGAFLLSAIFSSVAIPHWGAEGAYAALGLVCLLILPLALAVPARFARLDATSGILLPDRIGGLGLVGALAHLAAIMALWVYVVPLGRAAGLGEAHVRVVVSVAIGTQIVAGIGAIRFATLSAFRTVMLCALGSIVAIGLVASGAGEAAFAAGAILFSLCWVFVLPFHVPLLIELDPSRRSVMLLTSVQLAGVAVGPLLASIAIGSGAPGIAAGVATGLFAATILLFAVARRLKGGSRR